MVASSPGPDFHLAFIPDGNRRWAKRRGVQAIAGHERGIDRMGDVLKWCRTHKIRMVSFWAFSSENFDRDRDEVQGLFNAFETRLQKVMKEAEFDKYEVRVRFIGERSRFPFRIREGMARVERETARFSKYYVNLFIGYGGRAELVQMAKKIVQDYAGRPEKVDEKSISARLWTAGLPDPDLIIRTSGEQRISGFLPFQSVYSELYFCKKLWPDFGKKDLDAALNEFHRRKRRWGK